MTPASPERLNPSEILAAQTCADYIAMARLDQSHPLHAHADDLANENASEFALFAQDMADLVGLALAMPSVDFRSHVAAQSARRMLGRHPAWIRAASDWASSAELSKEAFEAVNHWLV